MTDDAGLGVYLVRAYIGRDSIVGICSTPEGAKEAAEISAASKGLALEWARPVEGTQETTVKWLGRYNKTVWYTVYEYELDAVLKGVIHG